MTLFRTQDIDALEGFTRLNPGEERAYEAVSTDSRSMGDAALFIPLRGERYDAHDFIDEAITAGAAGLVVERVPEQLPPVPVWKVGDTLQAMGDLAHAHRQRFDIPVLGLTGTSGKTTVKEMLRAVFSEYRVLLNEGNFNNLVGVPLTLFHLRPEHEFAVIEMGMNRFGEIGRLTTIANPTLGLINNVGAGHLEGVGGLEGVLKAKTELAREMRPEAPIILNADDPLLRRFGQGAQREVIWFGMQVGSDVSARDVKDFGLDGTTFTLVTGKGDAPVNIRLPGEHNVRNALAAAAAALAMGLDLEQVATGLSKAASFRMRNEVLPGPRGSRIISDCYNANPPSMRESLRLLASARGAGRIAAVLGDMLELGEAAASYHAALGEWISSVRPERVWFVGEWAQVVAQHAKGVDVQVVVDLQEVSAALHEWLDEGDTVLVKGSRGMKLDAIVASVGMEQND